MQTNLKLNILESLPEAFYSGGFEEVVRSLKGPTWLRLEGQRSESIFLSTLLHGDEVAGVLSLQRLLQRYRKQGCLPEKTIHLFFGNVEAAIKRKRYLKHQPDYNRIWAGSGEHEEFGLAKEVLEKIEDVKPEICVDIHNTSGRNPHYSCVVSTDNKTLELVKLFEAPAIYFTQPQNVLLRAMSKFAPSILLECGRSVESSGVDHCVQFLDRILSSQESSAAEICLFESAARIFVPEECSLSFEDRAESCDFTFRSQLDDMNFVTQREGTLLGWRQSSSLALKVVGPEGENVSEQFIRYEGDKILLEREATPAMFTTSSQAVKLDCLGYLLSRKTLSSQK